MTGKTTQDALSPVINQLFYILTAVVDAKRRG
jgi:hypothetical protein